MKMADTDAKAMSPGQIINNASFWENLFIATAIPITLGLAVWRDWINSGQLYIAFLVIYITIVSWLFVLRYIRGRPLVRQVGFLIFFGFPLMSMLIYTLFILLSETSAFVRADMLRGGFIVLCLLLPGGLYFQFVGSRRDSLLNSFIVVVDRLGLFDYRKMFQSPAFVTGGTETAAARPGRGPYVQETEFSRARRIRSYFERFEAIYGPLPSGAITDLVEGLIPLRPVAQNVVVARVDH
jgi:hypothetical protein